MEHPAIKHLIDYIEKSLPGVIGFLISVVLAIIVFFIGAKIIKIIRKFVRKSLEKANVDLGVQQFLDSVLKVVLFAILLFSIATNFGLDTASVAALFASGGVAIGLALQGSLSNFAGGVLILVLKPFVVGDYIIEDSNKNEGTVAEIQMFYTKLHTVDNRTVIIPNGMLANNSITNITAQEKRQLDLRFGISYESDIKKAKDILQTLIDEEVNILEEEDKRVFVHDLADSAVILGVRAWVKTEEYWNTRWKLIENIKLAFDENQIVIPYNQMDVYLKMTKE